MLKKKKRSTNLDLDLQLRPGGKFYFALYLWHYDS